MARMRLKMWIKTRARVRVRVRVSTRTGKDAEDEDEDGEENICRECWTDRKTCQDKRQSENEQKTKAANKS